MNARARCFPFLPKVSSWLGIACLSVSMLGLAQTAYKFDAATVSGLPARNIGSAMMSGRIAALDAVDQDGRITVFVASASVPAHRLILRSAFPKPHFRNRKIGIQSAEFIASRDQHCGTAG